MRLYMKLYNMSLLREFYLSVYCTSSYKKNFSGNSFKIGAYFKEKPLKKTVPKIFEKRVSSLFYKCFSISRTDFKGH